MKTLNMEFLGESEADEKNGKTACEKILAELPGSAASTVKNNLPWFIAGGVALIWITRRGKK